MAAFSNKGTCLAWSPDSTRLAVGTSRSVTLYTITSRKPGVCVKPLVLYGHRTDVVFVHFVESRGLVTVSSDGVLLCWRLRYNDLVEGYSPDTFPFVDETRNPNRRLFEVPVSAKLASRHFIKRAGARSLRSAHVREGMLVAGLSNGVFALFQLPDSMVKESDSFDQGLFEIAEMRSRKRKKKASASNLQADKEDDEDLLDETVPVTPFTDLTLLYTLSASTGPINRILFNHSGDWIALSSSTGQVLVWDWRAEVHILKQQAHLLSATALSFSPDGRAIATSSKDGRIKLWGVSTGFCAATFFDHKASVSALTFSGNDVIVSASLDGTVRAFDIRRYRNFRVMVAPAPRRQFGCVAVDAAGELVAAGCVDTFDVVVWSLRTGQLLELLNGHNGPVSSLAFRPGRGTLATASWDRTVRLWDMYERKGSCEVLEHSKEVLGISFRPDGKEFAACIASGEILFWDAEKGTVAGTIDGSRDAAHGRLRQSRTIAPEKGFFQTVCFSADGRFLLAGAASKHVCIYHVRERSTPTLVNKVAVTQNLDFDGLSDRLNSKHLTAGGHDIDTIDDDDEGASDFEEIRNENGKSLPGATSEQKLRRKTLIKAEVHCVHACATGRLWGAVSSEGVLVYGEGEGDDFGDTLFDPTNLEVDVTPDAARKAADVKDYATALLVALRLNERGCLNYVVEKVSPEDIHHVVDSVPILYFSRLIVLFAWRLDNTPHIEFNLMWAKRLMLSHGRKVHNVATDPFAVNTALRALNRACLAHSKRIMPFADQNEHMLQYLLAASKQSSSLKESSKS